jgi:aspartate/methionine/tyrosine aminotransferase
VASEAVVKFIQSRASHAVIPTFHSQAVAIAAYREGFDQAAAKIVGPTNASRAVIGPFLEQHGINHILGKGYYAFLDMSPWLEKGGFADTAELGSVLAENHGLAVVPGVYFSEHGGNWIRFSYALPPETTGAAVDRLWQALSSL